VDWPVRSQQLQTALTEFVEDAALHLQAELDAGAEVPFELASQSSYRRAAPLYWYRPLTGAFIRERWPALAGLASYRRAALLLEGFDGLDRYLITRVASAGRGGRRSSRAPGRADAALRALLEDVFAEQSDFDLTNSDCHAERLRGALERLDSSAHASAAEVTLLATLHGLTIASPELALAAGLTIAQSDALSGMPDEALVPPREARHEDPAHLLVTFTTEDTDVSGAVDRGRAVLEELLRALRLFGDGRVTLGRLAWVRVGTGGWGALALPWGGRPHGMLVVSATQEDELRAFCNLVSRRRPRDNALAWALARFELGCERPTELEALSDYLLALRAMLEPEGPASGLLAERLAALCATPAERLALVERVVRTLALEHSIIAGTGLTRPDGVALVRELADHLRALLRDVVCGHLDADLVALADELLAPMTEDSDGVAEVAGGVESVVSEDEAGSGEQMPLDGDQTGEILNVLI
jgi:hypothetical protein